MSLPQLKGNMQVYMLYQHDFGMKIQVSISVGNSDDNAFLSIWEEA